MRSNSPHHSTTALIYKFPRLSAPYDGQERQQAVAYNHPPPPKPCSSFREGLQRTRYVCHNTLLRMCLLADLQRDILSMYLQFLWGHYDYAGANCFTALHHTLQPIHMHVLSETGGFHAVVCFENSF
jgi:hypothetical protein